MSKRYRRNSITIDIWEIIDEIDDDLLLEACRDRKIMPAGPGETAEIEIVQEAYEALHRGRVAEACSILERLLYPKWRTPEDCQSEYDKMV